MRYLLSGSNLKVFINPIELALPDILLVLISLFFPPFPVAYRYGICSCDVLINICLCMLGFFPGLFHSWFLLLKHYERGYENLDEENRHIGGRVVYVAVPPSENVPPFLGNRQQIQEHQPANYETVMEYNAKLCIPPPAYSEANGSL